MRRRATADIKDLATQTVDSSANSELTITTLSDIASNLNVVIESMRPEEKK
jgi:hypothetical protein